MTRITTTEAITATVAECILDEGMDLVFAGYPIKWEGEPLTRVARHITQTLIDDGIIPS